MNKIFDEEYENYTGPMAILELGQSIFRGLNELGVGDAATSMGAVELVAKELRDGSDKIADAINNLAEATREHE
jgi:hypothetical protein